MKNFRNLSFVILLTGMFLACDKKQTTIPPAVKDFKPALLVIDIQNEYLPVMDQKDVKPGMEAINAVIGIFRKYQYPVIRVHHTQIGQGPAAGTEAFEFPKTVAVKDDDPQIIKNYPSAFTKTSLDSLLKAKGCNSVYLCGLSAVGCVLATYFGAMDRGYETYMVRDAIISHNADYTNMIRNITVALPVTFVELNLKVLSGDIKKLEDIPAETLKKEYGIATADQLNAIGYNLMYKGRLDDAIIVMKANLRVFPDEPNCYDSLGELYERDNQNALALTHYEKAYMKAKEKKDQNLAVFEKNYQRLKNTVK